MEEKLRKAGQACFYAGLLLELLIVLIDKSAYINPIEGQLFRVTFLLFALKVCLTKYTWKEWLWMLFFLVIAGLCYLASDRDEAVRLVVFCAAFKGIDLKKALTLAFRVTLGGCLVLVLLAAAGLLGQMYIVDADASRGVRYTFGLGHPNAFYCMFWVLVTLGIYLYHSFLRWPFYLVTAAAGWVLFRYTDSRTGFLFLLFTLVFAWVLLNCRKIREWKGMYVAGAVLILFCVGLSVVIASYEMYTGPFYPFDRYLTGRITSTFAFEDGGGFITNWRLFSRPENLKYFDMGYIRLFYWYGWIPAAVYAVMYALLILFCGKRKDSMGFLLLMCFGLYTMVEAHFVSVYLGRNYALFLLGACWAQMLHADTGPLREEYWWRGYRFLPGRSGQ